MDSRQPNYNRGRNTYLLFIGAGLFVLLSKVVATPATVISLFMVVLGGYCIRSGIPRKGYVLLIIGGFILVGSQFAVVLSLVLISLGYFYWKSRQMHGEAGAIQRTRIIESQKRNKEAWILRSLSLWCVIGELNLDFTLAIPEEPETTLMLQGMIGDIDLYIPEDMGVCVESSVLFGQVRVADEKESGTMNKIRWQSPHYETADTKVKLIVSYLVGDIDIKVL